MADVSDNLVPTSLRGMRSILDEHARRFDDHDRRCDELKEAIEDWQETTSTGAGFAMLSNLRTQAIEKELAELRRGVDRPERSH